MSEPNSHTTKWFSENLPAIVINETKVQMNMPVYIGLSMLDTSKTEIYKVSRKHKTMTKIVILIPVM